MSSELNFPTEVVDLPSKGLLYPEDHPLASGQVEIKYMTAREEDILTNPNFIERGVVIDKLLESLIVTKFDLKDLLSSDKDALLVAARILGYGKDYTFEYGGRKHEIDLTTIGDKEINESLFKRGENSFEFVCPATNHELTFKLLTQEDSLNIEAELRGLKKVKKDESYEVSTRMKYMVTSVNGNDSEKVIRDFVNNNFLARDARVFRKYVDEITPGLDLTFYPDEFSGGVNIPIGVTFLWPDARI